MPLPTDFVNQITRLDPMPVSVQRLMRALEDEDVGPAEIATFVENDPAMTSSVLRLANSAAYAGAWSAISLRAAIVRLGKAKILDTVLGGAIQKLKANVPMYGLGEDELWVHSAAAQLAVRALQQEVPSAGIPDSAATAALLHDLGKIILGRYMKADARVILGLSRMKAFTFVEAERELLGCDHTEAGAALARHWGLPDEIVRAIESHHEDPIADPSPTLDAVVVANLVAKSVNAGLGAEGLNLKIDQASTRRLGLNLTLFSRVCLQTHTQLIELKRAYSVAA